MHDVRGGSLLVASGVASTLTGVIGIVTILINLLMNLRAPQTLDPKPYSLNPLTWLANSGAFDTLHDLKEHASTKLSF